MARVNVSHSIDDLARDCDAIAVTAKAQGRKIVRRDVREGRELARKAAKAASGPHGSQFFERITDEMTGATRGEYGPSAVRGTRYTGVDGNAGAGRDLDKSLRVIGPKFGRDVHAMTGDLFWPGG